MGSSSLDLPPPGADAGGGGHALAAAALAGIGIGATGNSTEATTPTPTATALDADRTELAELEQRLEDASSEPTDDDGDDGGLTPPVETGDPSARGPARRRSRAPRR